MENNPNNPNKRFIFYPPPVAGPSFRAIRPPNGVFAISSHPPVFRHPNFPPVSSIFTSSNPVYVPRQPYGRGQSYQLHLKQQVAKDDGWAWNNQEVVKTYMPKPKRPRVTFPEDNHYDNFDGVDRYKAMQTGLRSDLFNYFTYEDFGVGSFDNLAATMYDLTHDGGIKKQVMKEGSETELIPPEGYIWMHYITFVEGNEEPIDSTGSRELLGSHKLGKGELLLGVEFGVKTMRVGEISKFLFEPEYAYGKLGCPTVIPSNSRILMVIEMVRASAVPLKKPIFQMSSRQRAEHSFEEIYKCADELREAGNSKVKFSMYPEAIERYEKALEILEEAIVFEKAQDDARRELMYKLFSNSALCHLRIDQPAQAAVACKAALKPNMPAPKNGKVYFRYAEANYQLRKYEEAWKYIKLALQFDPNDFALLVFRQQVEERIQKDKKELDDLYRRMYPNYQ